MFIWLLLTLLVIPASSENIRNANKSCIENERQALISFRNGLVDPANLLSSWQSEDKDCCRWTGVHCSQKTGHITALDLSPKINPQIDKEERDPSFGGEIGQSLLNLTHLHYLNLSMNKFTSFPAFIDSLNGMRYLNLTCSFLGSIVLVPPQLGNLSKLEYLDFGCWNGNVRIDTLDWISHLSSLRYLQMIGMNLSSVPNSFESTVNLPSLVSLSFSSCVISIPSSPFNFNSSNSLEVFHVSGGKLNSPVALFRWLSFSHKLVDLTLSFIKLGLQDSILNFVGTMTSLQHLDLSANEIQGQIPISWGNLCNLQTLDLSYNRLNGTLNIFQNWTTCPHGYVLREFRAAQNQLTGPFDFTKFMSLEVLDVSYNLFDGILPKDIWKLSNLTVLNVRSNFLEGVVSDSDINLHKLNTMDLSFNSFKLNLNSNWVPPFQLIVLNLNSCKLGPAFPDWIRTQENLVQLDISNSGISDTIPRWFWNLCDQLEYLNISNNNMRGIVPDFSSRNIVDMSNNMFHGPLPRFSSNVVILNLSRNKFSGNISFLCTGEFRRLFVLDLSSNLLSGYLPDCWINKENLQILDVSNNDFWGTIPGSMFTLPNLRSLHLSNNNLSGGLPSSFSSQQLISLGLGENQLSGNIPPWVGSLTKLVVLQLQSNKFWGSIPKSLCQMENIQILDLSLNNLSGTIPTCLNNLTIMAKKTSKMTDTKVTLIQSLLGSSSLVWYSFANTWIIWKGMKVEYQKTLGLLKLIDLSSNKLSGEIPVQIASLYGMISLNLSSNNLTGLIPGKIGQLQQLDSLDLSNNQLFGKIPESFSSISRLSYLNLSNNLLSGRIPSSTQMLSFNATSFGGNPELCGLPLTTKCSSDENVHPPPINDHGTADHSNEEDREWFKSPWFYSSAALGFVIGFWGICGPLVFYAPFRHAYFQFFNRLKDSFPSC